MRLCYLIDKKYVNFSRLPMGEEIKKSSSFFFDLPEVVGEEEIGRCRLR